MNKRGISTILVVIVTAVVTAMLCYIVYKASLIQKVYSEDDGFKTITSSMFSDNKNSKASGEKSPDSITSSLLLQSKMIRLKKIIDENYLYEYDDKKLVDSAAAGLVKGLGDQYASYYNESGFDSFFAQTEGEYVGIGIYVAFDKVMNMPLILMPLENSPAEEAGIKTGDYIEYVEDTYSDEDNYDEIIDMIKGETGTKVKIGIARKDENKNVIRKEYKVERKNIEINPISSEIYENNIGYLKMTSWDEVAYDNFKAKYDELLKDKKVKGLIIDIRDNPGGVLEICTKITDLIVPEGKIVYTIDKKGNEEAIYSDKTQIEIPLVVLVNENSASASEVFSGAIKDYGIGTIIGTKTYGKGLVQTLKSLGDGTYIKLTTAEYFSPKGNKINGEGVSPDIEIALPEGKNSYNIKFEEDVQLQPAIEEIKNKI